MIEVKENKEFKDHKVINGENMKQGWEIKKLGEVCESDLGKTLNQSKDKGELRPYLCAINVLWDKFDFTTLKETRFEDSEIERYSVRKGDLLICEGGDIGRAAIWDYDDVIQYQNALHRVRLNESVLSRFLLFYLKHLKDSGVLDTRYGKGVTIKHLVKSSLLSIPIPIPPLPEQEKIVAELDCLSGIIEKKKQQLKELDALAESIFFTMFGDPITNEKGWEVKKLGEICDVRDGTHDSPKYLGHSDYVLITSKNITSDGNIDFSTANYISKEDYDAINKRSFVERGDIIMAMIGTIGKPIIVKNMDRHFCIKNVALIKFRGSTQVVNSYIQALLNNAIFGIYIQSLNKGGTQKFIALGTIRSLQTPIPPLPLQQEFADKIEAIEKQKELIKQSITETEELFNSRMDYYFN